MKLERRMGRVFIDGQPSLTKDYSNSKVNWEPWREKGYWESYNELADDYMPVYREYLTIRWSIYKPHYCLAYKLDKNTEPHRRPKDWEIRPWIEIIRFEMKIDSNTNEVLMEEDDLNKITSKEIPTKIITTIMSYNFRICKGCDE